MDGSDKGFSSKPSSIPKISGSVDAEGLYENDPRHSFQNPKKPTTKNFMSPTISAASKAAIPRKKILAERNGASGSISPDTHFSKTPQDKKSPPQDLGINGSDSPLCRTTPLSYRASESEDDGQNSAPDLSSKPYDPLTNYLSPRPKFLRYNPTRRREIFLLKEEEIKDGKDRLSISRNVSFESQNAGDEDGTPDTLPQGQNEDEEIVKDDVEIEEEEEERGENCFKGVLNALFVFAILLLSTSYISSMNSPTPSPVVEAIEVLKDGYLKIQSHILEAASENGHGFTRAVAGFQNGYLKIQSLMVGATTTSVKISESQSDFMEQQQEWEMGLMEAYQEAVDGEVVGDENGGVEEETDQLGQVEENEGVCDKDMEEAREVSDQMAENMEFVEKTAEKFEPFQDDLIKTPEPAVPGVSEKDLMNTDSISKYEQEEDDGIEVAAEEVKGVEKIANKENTNIGVANLEPEVNLILELMETESIPKNVIWAIFAIIVSSLVLGFHLKHQKTPKKDSPMTVNQCSESVVAEKSSVAVILPPKEGVVHIEKVESYEELSVEEPSQELSQSGAPTVELLGEFVVGEVSSSSTTTPKTFSKKSRMTMEESEESNHYSVSQEKRGTHSVPIQTPATLSALSTMDSPSYGSFTAGKSVRKKEDGGDGEVMKIVTTPVRRSSRLRNRSVMSP